jgi:hypothetical protein
MILAWSGTEECEFESASRCRRGVRKFTYLLFISLLYLDSRYVIGLLKENIGQALLALQKSFFKRISC